MNEGTKQTLIITVGVLAFFGLMFGSCNLQSWISAKSPRIQTTTTTTVLPATPPVLR